MSYQPNRLTIGYERAKVLNPWVFADFGQPQRMRGYVSPLVYQTSPPAVYHPNLSGLGVEEQGAPTPTPTPEELQQEQRALQRAAFEMQKQSVRLSKRMAAVSLVSLGIAVAGLTLSAIAHYKRSH